MKQRRQRNILIILGVVIGMVGFLLNNWPVIIYGLLLLGFAVLFFSKFYKNRLKRHYAGFIQENYSKRFGEEVTLELKDDAFYTKDQWSEGSFNFKGIEEIVELSTHFLIGLSSGITIIVPKRVSNAWQPFKEKLPELGVPFRQDLEWQIN